jgi:hypothetical protein
MCFIYFIYLIIFIDILFAIRQYVSILIVSEFNLIDRIKANVTTSQSSIFSPDSNYNSRKAIDGKPNYLIDTCKCCSVTNGTSPSWWQIDLGKKYLIGGLQIFGRAASKIISFV